MITTKNRKIQPISLLLVGALLATLAQCGSALQKTNDLSTPHDNISLEDYGDYGNTLEELLELDNQKSAYEQLTYQLDEVDDMVLIGKFPVEIPNADGTGNKTVSYFQEAMPVAKVDEETAHMREAIFKTPAEASIAERLSDPGPALVFLTCGGGVTKLPDDPNPKKCARMLTEPKHAEKILYEYKVKQYGDQFYRMIEVTGKPGRTIQFLVPKPIGEFAEVGVLTDSTIDNLEIAPVLKMAMFSDRDGEILRREYTGKLLMFFSPKEVPNNIAELSATWERMQFRQTLAHHTIIGGLMVWGWSGLYKAALGSISNAILTRTAAGAASKGLLKSIFSKFGFQVLKSTLITSALLINVVGDLFLPFEKSPNWTPKEEKYHKIAMRVYYASMFAEIGTMFIGLVPGRLNFAKTIYFKRASMSITGMVEDIAKNLGDFPGAGAFLKKTRTNAIDLAKANSDTISELRRTLQFSKEGRVVNRHADTIEKIRKRMEKGQKLSRRQLKIWAERQESFNYITKVSKIKRGVSREDALLRLNLLEKAHNVMEGRVVKAQFEAFKKIGDEAIVESMFNNQVAAYRAAMAPIFDEAKNADKLDFQQIEKLYSQLTEAVQYADDFNIKMIDEIASVKGDRRFQKGVIDRYQAMNWDTSPSYVKLTDKMKAYQMTSKEGRTVTEVVGSSLKKFKDKWFNPGTN